jgi:glycolate oxidase FAD binding subunit
MADNSIHPAVLELAELVRSCAASGTPVYPRGGETALDYGLAGKQPGETISLSKLNQLIDYPARDLTITVHAGMTVAEIQQILAVENQELPIDIPHADRATIGGAIATNVAGSRRFGQGTLRDYVIGIEAIDGQGNIYHGGGRVVKNVAGYDFCRLLIGSCGTLGIITQVTLKVKPRPAQHGAVIWPIHDWTTAKQLQELVLQSAITPTVIDLVDATSLNATGLVTASANQLGWLVVGLSGTHSEVEWMVTTLCEDLASFGSRTIVTNNDWPKLLSTLTALTAHQNTAQLMLKWNQAPSQVVEQLVWLQANYPAERWLAHAGSGVIWSQHDREPPSILSQWLLQVAHPRASQMRGNLHPWYIAQATDLSRAAMWGSLGDAAQLTAKLQSQFDPQTILNRGRFW